MIPLGRDEMRANISFFAGGVDFVGVDFCENHPTLYLVPAKWDHINSHLQFCCLQTALCNFVFTLTHKEKHTRFQVIPVFLGCLPVPYSDK